MKFSTLFSFVFSKLSELGLDMGVLPAFYGSLLSLNSLAGTYCCLWCDNYLRRCVKHLVYCSLIVSDGDNL
jgi:hypothetical protein